MSLLQMAYKGSLSYLALFWAKRQRSTEGAGTAASTHCVLL